MIPVPCAGCETLLELSSLACTKCGDKNPFECSMCHQRIRYMEMYDVDNLASWKPVFCKTCGPQAQVVKCRHCKTSILRSSGHERKSRGGDARVYHEDCWKIYELQLRTVRMVRLTAIPSLALLFAWMGYSQWRNVIMGVLDGALGASLGYLASLLFTPRD